MKGSKFRKKKLTGPQATAFARPCFAAVDTRNARYRSMVQSAGRIWSVMLTANVGLE